MANLFKVSGYSPVHSKIGISISLLTSGNDQAVIMVNKEIELNLNYKETKSFELNGTKYSIQLNNTFIEHWDKVYNCYVFVLNEANGTQEV